MSTTLAVVDRILTEAELAELGLAAEPGSTSVEHVVLGLTEHLCVVHLPDHTVIADGGDHLAQLFDVERLDQPGSWHVALSDDTAELAEYRVFRSGELVRHLIGQRGRLGSSGEPVADEASFLIGGELDGDLLIQHLPATAGATAGGRDFDVLALTGQAHRPRVRETVAAGAPKRGFFRRLFGS